MEPIYLVLVIILIIWAGIFGYMIYLDKEIKSLSKKFLTEFAKRYWLSQPHSFLTLWTPTKSLT